MTSTRRGAAALGIATTLTLVSCASLDPADSPGDGRDNPARVAATGFVRAAPTCPIEGADQSCLRAPVEGVLVELMHGGIVSDSTRTDFQGRFRLFGEPGLVTIRATTTHGLPGEAADQITLTASTQSRVKLLLNTSIRSPLTAP